jgi:hypothetical protein
MKRIVAGITPTVAVVEASDDFAPPMRTGRAARLGAHAHEDVEALVAVADEAHTIDLGSFEHRIARGASAGGPAAVVETYLEFLSAKRTIRAVRLGGNADEGLESTGARNAVAHCGLALDLGFIEVIVTVLVRAETDANATVRARVSDLVVRLDDRVQTVVAVVARLALRALLSGISLFTLLALQPSGTFRTFGSALAFRAVIDFGARTVRAGHHRAAVLLSNGAGGAVRAVGAVFPASRDHQHDTCERRTDDPTAPNPVP